MCSYGQMLSARLRRKNSLPCVKGGGSRKADGGIVILAGGDLVMSATAILSYSPKKVCKEWRTGGRFRISPPCVPLIETAKGAYCPLLIPLSRQYNIAVTTDNSTVGHGCIKKTERSRSVTEQIDLFRVFGTIKMHNMKALD